MKYKVVQNVKNQKNQKKLFIVLGALILIGIFTLIGTTYAVFSVTLHGEKKVVMTTGSLKVDIEDEEYITLKDWGTLTDKQGKKSDPYRFTITNNGTIGAYYQMYLTEPEAIPGTELMDLTYIKYELRGDDGTQEEGKIKYLDKFFQNKYIEPQAKVKYELRLWISDEIVDNSQAGKTYQSKLVVEGSQLEIVEKEETAVEKFLVNFTNSEDTEFDTSNADNSVNHKMFVFHHDAGTQQEGWSKEELTDYRYIGVNPNNYVTFNGEEAGWRIIGIFTVENEKGEKEKRIKLIRNKTYSVSGTNSDNDWTHSISMKTMNPENSESNELLNGEALSMIGDAKYYIGGALNTDRKINTSDYFYAHERGNESCKTNGTCDEERPFYWIGKVGLMYPSDYGYATSGVSRTDREKCLSIPLYSWDSNGFECRDSSWIPHKSTKTMTPVIDDATGIFWIGSSGYVTRTAASSWDGYPVLYLSSNVKYKSGGGTQNDPFIFYL